MKKYHIIYAVFWLVAIIAVFQFMHMPAAHTKAGDGGGQGEFIKGEIADIEGENIYIKLANPEKSVIKTQLDDFYLHDDYKSGDWISVYVNKSESGETEYDIADYYHLDGLIFVFIIFCILALSVARKKGFYSIASVLLSLFFFYGIMLGAIKAGFSVILAGVIYVFLITVLTVPLIHGFNKKSLSAIITVNFGYAIGFLLTYFFSGAARIGNTPSEHFRTLFIQFPDTDIRQIVMVSLFLGAVGALIDVAVSICSAVFEGLKEHPHLTFKKAYALGMEVGKDILGSMINTLLIAYMAASFPFLVLMSLAGFNNAGEFMNYDFITLELVRIFIGAAAIVLLIPVTAVTAAYFAARK